MANQETLKKSFWYMGELENIARNVVEYLKKSAKMDEVLFTVNFDKLEI